jgi:hypothetical protein
VEQSAFDLREMKLQVRIEYMTKSFLDTECSPHGDTINAYKFLIEKHQVNRPLGRHRLGGRIILKLILAK